MLVRFEAMRMVSTQGRRSRPTGGATRVGRTPPGSQRRRIYRGSRVPVTRPEGAADPWGCTASVLSPDSASLCCVADGSSSQVPFSLDHCRCCSGGHFGSPPAGCWLIGLARGVRTGCRFVGRWRPGSPGSAPGRGWPCARERPDGGQHVEAVVGVGQVHPGHRHARGDGGDPASPPTGAVAVADDQDRPPVRRGRVRR